MIVRELISLLSVVFMVLLCGVVGIGTAVDVIVFPEARACMFANQYLVAHQMAGPPNHCEGK
jgi:hypothetical protein